MGSPIESGRISRRRLIQRSGVTTVLALTPPLTGDRATARKQEKIRLFEQGEFPDGVISGDPASDGITLWTRIADVPKQAGKVTVEVATDDSFKTTVARKSVLTSPDTGHTVKVRVKGLKPYERYYYRFESKDTASPVGRFQTALPPDSQQPVRFAFFSCQDFTHGYYNAHQLMATEDIDFVLNLGDYIYADRQHTGPTAVRKDPIEQARTLAQYRAKYRLYRSDPALRKMHSLFPMVSTWDDHEVTDNYAGKDPRFKNVTARQLAAAYRAFFENMPTFPIGRNRIYRSHPYGRNLELIVLDERQYRSRQPCEDRPIVDPEACSDWNSPRNFLGPNQLSFLKSRLAGSQATWKAVANELLTEPIRFERYELNIDAWAGYRQEREEVMNLLANQEIKNTVFLTGDIHIFSAGNVSTQQGVPVATEFAGGSITSSSIGEQDILLPNKGTFPGNDRYPRTSPQLVDLLKGENPWAVDYDPDLHGYGLAKVYSDRFEVSFRRVKTIKQRSAQAVMDRDYRVEAGIPKVVKL